MLIRIKNAYLARRKEVNNIVYSRLRENVLKLLKQYKFIAWYTTRKNGKHDVLEVSLFDVKDKTTDVPVVKFYSKPSRKWYVGYKDIKPVANGLWIGIISTSKWVIASHVAKKQKIWGELIAEIY